MKKLDCIFSLRFVYIFVLIFSGIFMCHETVKAVVVTKRQAVKDNLQKGFVSPPNTAKPRVWWHWMNGNITKDGIRKDLMWMYRTGIGGFQNFDANITTPQVVKKRLSYMTPGWKDAFKYTARLADSLHLEMAIAGSPGWSESGGSWVKKEDGMKKYVWSEVFVKGGELFDGKLLQPSSVAGPIQNVKHADSNYYKDVAVVAFKVPEEDKTMLELNPEVTSSDGNITLEGLIDGDLSTAQLLPYTTDHVKSWIQFKFKKPQQIKAITIVTDRGQRILLASDDGSNFKEILSIPETYRNFPQETLDIPATTARYFRVMFQNPSVYSKRKKGDNIQEIVLHTVTRINNFEEKAAFVPVSIEKKDDTPETKNVINESDIIDLTGKMNPDGSLKWKIPEGKWKIIRLGYSLTGITNHPATPEATGPEVDKLDPLAVKKYFTNYLDQYEDATGGLMGDKGGLQYMITDSWEARSQNWTGNMMQEFQKRCGYSMMPWIPVLMGYIVKSSQESDDFLWDFRKALSEMVAEYHYDQLTDILKTYGMKRYTESHEYARALIADGMDVKRRSDIPMSAMWVHPEYNDRSFITHEADIRESASVAHIYGQNLVAAESLTVYGGHSGVAFSFCPENLKPTADLELASGLNRFVIHTSVHQPVDEKMPGLGLGPYGEWFTRHETWAEDALPWTTYLARSSYLLQQGKFVGDVVYYYGEDNNITSLFGQKLPDVPEGYNYDFINPDALINLLSVKDGKLVTPSGMSYRLLVLDSNAVKMSLPVLQKIEKLVKEGATICGVEPQVTPSLSDDQSEFSNIIKEIWHSGNSRVYTGKTIAEVLKLLNIVPDFTYTKPFNDTKLLYVHRKLTDRDIYWVNNRTGKVQNVKAGFRIYGKTPEIWHPETGKTEAASYNMADGITKVNLHLQPGDAVFVVFKDETAKTSFTVPEISEKVLSVINGDWEVSFQENRGAPSSVIMDELKSWTKNDNFGVKYFSGTAIYKKTIMVDRKWFIGGSKLLIDLGEVKNIAELFVNGKSQGTLWKTPFCLDVTKSLRPGKNILEVKVTNLWVNRLIGDLQPEVKQKITYTTMDFYRANSPLLPSGLLGPVRIIRDSVLK